MKRDSIDNMSHKQPKAEQTYISCEECGYVVQTVELEPATKATCPRCQHTLTQRVESATQQVTAYGIACLIAFAMSLAFPFMSFNARGLISEIHLFDAAVSMSHFNYDILSVLTILCVFVLPIAYILVVMFLYQYSELKRRFIPLSVLRVLTTFSHHSKPWLMVDVFLTGVLVALVKILSLAKVGFGMSFWALCIYTLLLVKLMTIVDETSLWDKFKKRKPTQTPDPEIHRSEHFDECHVCSQISPIEHGEVNYCVRCHAQLKPFNPQQNMQIAWALLIAAAVFYIPANLYPIMYTTSMGSTAVSTILSGVALLWSYKSYPVAMIIFFASIIIPIAKIMTLCGIYWHAQKQNIHTQEEANKQLKLYRITEFIGRWSMIDIFVVALLAALVQLGRAMSIEPGMAGVCFGLVVILTMISAHVFDPRVLWHLQTQPMESTSESGSLLLVPHIQSIEKISTIYSASPVLFESKSSSLLVLAPTGQQTFKDTLCRQIT